MSEDEGRETVEAKHYGEQKEANASKAFLAYLLGWLGGLIIFLMEKEDRYLRFHALQSLLWNAIFWIVLVCLLVGFLTMGLLGQNSLIFRLISILCLLALIAWFFANLYLWIRLMVASLKGEWYKVPVLGDKAEQIA
jgi:uncharacterized membrane protein